MISFPFTLLHLLMLKQRVRSAFKAGDTVGTEAQSFTYSLMSSDV